MKKKYMVWPGKVYAHDGDVHYIKAGQLIDLYGVDPSECIICFEDKPETYRGYDETKYIHLHPRYDGDYGLRKF